MMRTVNFVESLNPNLQKPIKLDVFNICSSHHFRCLSTFLLLLLTVMVVQALWQWKRKKNERRKDSKCEFCLYSISLSNSRPKPELAQPSKCTDTVFYIHPFTKITYSKIFLNTSKSVR